MLENFVQLARRRMGDRCRSYGHDMDDALRPAAAPEHSSRGTPLASGLRMISAGHPANDVVIRRRFEHARVVNLLAGLWLIASTWLWKHFESSQLNTWLIGAFVASVALLALRRPALRWVNALLGAWLLLSTLLFIRPVQPATWWNNLLVGLTVLGCALLSHRGALTTIPPRTEPPSTRA